MYWGIFGPVRRRSYAGYLGKSLNLYEKSEKFCINFSYIWRDENKIDRCSLGKEKYPKLSTRQFAEVMGKKEVVKNVKI